MCVCEQTTSKCFMNCPHFNKIRCFTKILFQHKINFSWKDTLRLLPKTKRAKANFQFFRICGRQVAGIAIVRFHSKVCCNCWGQRAQTAESFHYSHNISNIEFFSVLLNTKKHFIIHSKINFSFSISLREKYLCTRLNFVKTVVEEMPYLINLQK